MKRRTPVDALLDLYDTLAHGVGVGHPRLVRALITDMARDPKAVARARAAMLALVTDEQRAAILWNEARRDDDATDDDR